MLASIFRIISKKEVKVVVYFTEQGYYSGLC